MGAREKWIKHRSQGCRPKNIIFAHVQKTYENLMDFNSSDFHKNSPREITFYFCHTYNAFWTVATLFVLRLQRFCPFFCLFICVHVSTALFAPHRSPKLHFGSFNKTYHISPLSLTILTKHTVKPQCRCWCDFCPTSPAPLLEISETLLFLS